MIDIIGVTATSTLILLVGLYGDDWFWRIQMNDNLPPPNWSPTGDEGYWVWRNENWKWLTDEEYKELKAEEE